ncbi:MAG TPA: GNAT family protein [Anaerolineales bacterium]|nr:GNAT family protein [Anaerolineales bacterium]
MMEVAPLTLVGKVVRLEPLSEAHVAGLTAVGMSEDIWRWMPYGVMKNEEEIRGWVRELLSRAANGTDRPFAVIHLASGRVAGATRYMDIHPKDYALEIGGTWYGVEFQRTAVNTESKYLLLRHAFEGLKCIRVQLKADLRNTRSQKAIERLGAVREGVLRHNMIMPDGYYRSSVYYSILDQEWPAVKARLEGMMDKGGSRHGD